jgi:predicted Zn-dependent protease
MSELPVAAAVVELVADLAGRGAEAEVGVHRTAQALTRFANSAIHQNVADETTTVRLRVHVDGRTCTGSTTVTGAAGLRGLVERTVAAARLSPPDPGWPGVTPPAPPPTVARRFDDATAHAGPAARAALVRDFVDAAGGLETAGYCRTEHTSAAFANSAGQAVEGRTAEAAMDGIARVGGADGVARRAAGRLTDLDGAALGARAAAKARAGVDPVELPPGRYEVVLEPEAVADLLANLALFGFNGRYWVQRQSFAEPGAQQFDPSVTVVDDPAGADTGPADLPFDAEGTPRSGLVLVRRGTTVAVTHDRRSAAEAGAASTGHASVLSAAWGPVPHHLRLEPGPVPPRPAPGGDGPVAASALPLLAGVRRGLLVTDLWYTRVLDQKSLVVTGLTRNGVWLVEGGEVAAPVRNMRFTQSYPQALAPGAVLGVGAEAVLLPDRWSQARYAAPAVRLADWKLTGNAAG